MPTVQTPVAELQYEERGAGGPVLFLHGFPDSPRTWDAVLDRIDGVRALVPYLRGYGGSRVTLEAARSGEPAALARDVLEFADALGLESFHIVGHDWGARAAFNASSLAPERVKGIVALASPYVMNAGGEMPPSQVQAHWYQWFFNTGEGGNALVHDPLPLCRRLWKVWSPNWNFSEADFDETARAWQGPQWADTTLHSYRYRHRTEPGVPYYAKEAAFLKNNPQVETPTLYAHGLGEGCNLPESADGQEEWFGHYTRIDVPVAGHFVQRERPDVVADLVERMLGR